MSGATTPGRLPPRQDTALADVLARALAGEALTAIDALTTASTMRLAGHVNALATRWGWTFVTEDRATGCRDGRVAHVSVYRLDPEAITAANDAGAAEWCAGVRRARAALRARAAEAAKRARRANEARRQRAADAAQLVLFDGSAP